MIDEKTEFLPLGSTMVIKGGIRKYVVVARALKVNVNGR